MPLLVGSAPAEVAAVLRVAWNDPGTRVVVSSDLALPPVRGGATGRPGDGGSDRRRGAAHVVQACRAGVSGLLFEAARRGLTAEPRPAQLGRHRRLHRWSITVPSSSPGSRCLSQRARSGRARAGARRTLRPAVAWIEIPVGWDGGDLRHPHPARCCAAASAASSRAGRWSDVRTTPSRPRSRTTASAVESEERCLAVEVSLLAAHGAPPLAEAEACRGCAQGRRRAAHLAEASRHLPQVWSQLPQPEEFLRQLKRKGRARSGVLGAEVRLFRTRWRSRGRRPTARRSCRDPRRTGRPAAYLTRRIGRGRIAACG